MSAHNIACGLVWILTGISLQEMSAQTKPANPAPAPPPQVQEEAAPGPEDSSRTSQVKGAVARVWYFGSKSAPRVTIACAAPGGEPVAFGSYVPTGRMLSYRPIRPGEYTFYVLEGSVVPSPENGKISIDGKKLAEFSGIKFSESQFTTIALVEKDGKFSLESMADKLPDGGAGPRIRICDFAADNSLNILLGEFGSGKEKEIWRSGTGNPSIIPALGAPNPYIFHLCKTEGTSRTPLSSYEATLSATSAISLVVFHDRNGETSIRGVKDASGDFGAEETKPLAQENIRTINLVGDAFRP